MKVIAWALGPVETEARARRLHAFPRSTVRGMTPDESRLSNWQGFAGLRSDRSLARVGSSQEQLATDEGHLRVFWRKWNAMMEAHA
jgi:p-cumate 2,3-dioxygenase alpha subunit